MGTRLAVAALLVTVTAILAGCVDQPDVPADCGQPTATRAATLTATGLEPRDVGVCRGQQVKLEVQIQADGVLHIHGYDAESKEVRVGQDITFDFTADRAGQFVIELHTADGAGVSAGVFTVHEP